MVRLPTDFKFYSPHDLNSDRWIQIWNASLQISPLAMIAARQRPWLFHSLISGPLSLMRQLNRNSSSNFVSRCTSDQTRQNLYPGAGKTTFPPVFFCIPCPKTNFWPWRRRKPRSASSITRLSPTWSYIRRSHQYALERVVSLTAFRNLSRPGSCMNSFFVAASRIFLSQSCRSWYVSVGPKQAEEDGERDKVFCRRTANCLFP